MRKLLLLLLSCTLLFCFAGCNPVTPPNEEYQSYEVKFMLNDEVYETRSSDKDGKVSIPFAPTVGEGFAFDGWYLDNGVWEQPFTKDSVVTQNIEVYAKVIPVPYEVKFMVDGELYQTLQANQNGKVNLPNDPDVEDGFYFDGWYLDDGVWSQPFTANTSITSNVEVYAKISQIYFKVKFMVKGNLHELVYTDENGYSVFPNNPTVAEGFAFEGWYLDDGVWSQPFTTETAVSVDTEVYAKITRVSYSVKFMVDGSLYQKVVTDRDGNFTMLELNLGCGYVFEGWYLDDGVWSQPFTTTCVSDDMVVYAKLYKHVLNSVYEGTIETLNVGAKVWSTNDYVFTNLPKAFEGKPYILWTINGPNKILSLRSGWVYAITGEVKDLSSTVSQMETLDNHNFTLLDTAFWNIWSAPLKNNYVYEKYVEKGEKIELGRWSVLIMSDTKLDLYENEPMPTDEELAVLQPSGSDTVQTMAYGATVFSDRSQYTFYDMPFWLAGKNYILSGYATESHSATVTKSGELYMFTSKGGDISIVNSLVSAGWTDVTNTIPSNFNFFGDSTQNGAFLNSPYNGYALLKKQVQKGDTITWGKWGIPVFSGEFVIADNIAKLVSASDTTFASKVEDKMRLFSDRTYYAMNGIPLGLEGLTYFMAEIEAGATVEAETAGVAYILIPSDTNTYATLEEEVISAGWKMVPHRAIRLAVGQLFGNKLYYKNVEVGEKINFAKYNLIFGAPYENEEDYYVMPSLSTPADVIVNPVGDAYDINLQNWLGCPTIEKTAGGRLWVGWFTGGERELGTGNYAIIKYSDNEGVSWHQAVAVVHPDTAVQVTKPELWTAPNGDLWLIWIQHTGTGNFDGIMGTWASICTNPDAENPTWSSPKRLTDGYMRSKPIIVDVNGTTTWMYTAFDWMQPHYTRVYASTDNGATWSFRGKAECLDYSSGKNNLDDPVLVQKPDGTLWLLMRPSSGNYVYQSFSYDGGYTWTNARPAVNISGPQSRFTIDLLDDGRMLMVFHDSLSRNILTAYLSEDGGETWSHKLVLDERYVSYPDTIITSTGEIYVIYDCGRTSDMEVWMTVFTVDDIIAGKYVSAVSRQKVLVDKPNK